MEHEFGVRPLAILSSLTSNGAQNNDSHFHEATDENALGFIELTDEADGLPGFLRN